LLAATGLATWISSPLRLDEQLGLCLNMLAKPHRGERSWWWAAGHIFGCGRYRTRPRSNKI